MQARLWRSQISDHALYSYMFSLIFGLVSEVSLSERPGLADCEWLTLRMSQHFKTIGIWRRKKLLLTKSTRPCYWLWQVIVITCPAKVKSFNVSRGCGSCIIATSCIIASSECATLKDASSAGRVITVLLLVTWHLTSMLILLHT